MAGGGHCIEAVSMVNSNYKLPCRSSVTREQQVPATVREKMFADDSKCLDAVGLYIATVHARLQLLRRR